MLRLLVKIFTMQYILTRRRLYVQYTLVYYTVYASLHIYA